MTTDPGKLTGPGALPTTAPETVTEFMEGYFSDLQTQEMSQLGVNWTSLESPTFNDTMTQMEMGFPSGLNLYPYLDPPKKDTKDIAIEVDAYVLQKLVAQLPQPYQAEVTAAIKGGKASSTIQELVAGLKSYAMLYQGVMQAGQIEPPASQNWFNTQNGLVSNGIQITKAFTMAAGKVVQDVHNGPAGGMLGFLAQLSKDLLAYQNTMLLVEASNAEVSQKFTEASQANTYAEMTAQQNVLFQDYLYLENQIAEAQQKEIGIGAGLIGLAILAAIISILTFGASSAAAIGILMVATGLLVAGSNMLAQGLGKPSLGSLIENAIQQNPAIAGDMLAISASVMAISAILTIISFGALSFMEAGGLSFGIAATAGIAGTIGMEAMTQAFTDSMEQSLVAKGMSQDQASKAAQGVMGAIMGVVLIAGLGKGLGQMISAAPRFFTQTVPRFIEGLSSTNSSAANATGEATEEAINASEEAISAARSGSGTGGGGPGGGGPGGGGGGGGGGGMADAAASSTQAVQQAVRATAKVTQAVLNTVTKYGQITAQVVNEVGNIMQAMVSLAQYNVLMAEATISVDQATLEEVQILTNTFSKMMQAAAQNLTEGISEASDTIASVQPLFNEVVNNLSQAVAAITSNSASHLKAMQSASVAPDAPKVSSSSATLTKEQIERAAENVLAPGVSLNAVNQFSAMNTASKEGISGKMMSAPVDSKQQIALAQLLSVLADKIGDMLVAQGCDPRLAKRLGREIAPQLLKALLNGKPGQNGKADMNRPMLVFLAALMQNKPMSFLPASQEQSEITEEAGKDPELAEFMGKIKSMMSPDGKVSPSDFANILTELCGGIIQIGKKGTNDPLVDPNKLLDYVLGDGASDQISAAMGLPSSIDLAPALEKLLKQDENPFEQFSRYSPA